MALAQETSACNAKDYEGVIGIVTIEQLKHCLFLNNFLKEVKKHDILHTGQDGTGKSKASKNICN